MSMTRALVISASDYMLPLLGLLEESGFDVYSVSSCEQARQFLGSEPEVQVVFTDEEAPGGGWGRVLKDVAQICMAAEIIVCTRFGDERLWCNVLERGAYDLLVAPYQMKDVQWVVEGALKGRRDSLRSNGLSTKQKG
ncbi:MAG: hypothetical protein U0V70_07210 [Terriglobia bacterium]